MKPSVLPIKLLVAVLLLLSLTSGAFRKLAKASLHPDITQSIILKCNSSTPYFLYYFDDFLEEHTIQFKRDKQTGKSIDVELKTDHPLFLRFSGNNDQLLVLANPGDIILVDPALKRTIGNRGAEHLFYNILEQKGVSMAIPDFWNLDWTPTMNFRAVTAEFNRLCQARKDILDSLHHDSLISDKFYKKAGYEIKSSYIASLLIPFEKKHTTSFTCANLPNWYLDSLSSYKSFFTEDGLLGASSLQYRYCLNMYVSFLHYQDRKTNPLITKKETIVHHLSNRHKDFALFYLALTQLQDEQSYDEALYDAYYKEIETKTFSAYLNKFATSIVDKRAVLTADRFSKTQLEDMSGKPVSWQTILAKNKNKVAYIDMWASWCAPCRREMPGSIRLSNQLKNKKVNFVYISIDQDRTKWLTSLKKLSLHTVTAQHYRLNPTDSLAYYLTNNAIPKYIVIDRMGKVKTMDGMRPSDAGIKPLLTSLADN